MHQITWLVKTRIAGSFLFSGSGGAVLRICISNKFQVKLMPWENHCSRLLRKVRVTAIENDGSSHSAQEHASNPVCKIIEDDDQLALIFMS